MSHDILIAIGRLTVIDRSEGDVIALPNFSPEDGASLITEADWVLMVDDAGSEEAVMELLGTSVIDPETEEVVAIPLEDCRQEDEWHYVPAIIEYLHI